jgi:NAD(P)H-flavin reductase
MPANDVADCELIERLDRAFRATVHAVHRITPTIVEVIIKAPAAALAFQPGQFFRLQNFESLAPVANGTKQAMEGLALTGAWVDRDRGLVSTIVLEMGGSSDLCKMLRPADPVILMGPTGSPTEIAPAETYLFAGGGLGNAVLFSIGQAARSKGCKVLYFAAYKKQQDRFKVDQIEQVIVIGSDAMMGAVGRAQSTFLRSFLRPELRCVASINSPMQCMMKEICGQCLQIHRDPATGDETVVFSCANQDQPLQLVDFGSLRMRLRQNSAQEKLTRRWIEFVTSGLEVDAPSEELVQ